MTASTRFLSPAEAARRLGVSAKAGSLEAARDLAYRAADRISFDRMQRRNDIGARPATL